MFIPTTAVAESYGSRILMGEQLGSYFIARYHLGL